MVLEDRAGRDIGFLSDNTQKFLQAARARPELASVSTTFLPTVPQVFVEVDRDKVLKQGINLADVTARCRVSWAADSSIPRSPAIRN